MRGKFREAKLLLVILSTIILHSLENIRIREEKRPHRRNVLAEQSCLKFLLQAPISIV